MGDRTTQWYVTSSLLQVLARIMVTDQQKLNDSDFHHYLSVNEYGLALEELAHVVNDF